MPTSEVISLSDFVKVLHPIESPTGSILKVGKEYLDWPADSIIIKTTVERDTAHVWSIVPEPTVEGQYSLMPGYHPDLAEHFIACAEPYYGDMIISIEATV